MSSTILPPRTPADTMAALPAFPIDFDVPVVVTDSIRPTWIPVDPITFVPPKKKRSRAGLFALGAVGALTVWSLGFAAMLGAQSIHDQYVKRAAAAAARAQAPASVAVEAPVLNPAPVVSQAKSDDVILTVNVNDLPKSKDFKAKQKS